MNINLAQAFISIAGCLLHILVRNLFNTGETKAAVMQFLSLLHNLHETLSVWVKMQKKNFVKHHVLSCM